MKDLLQCCPPARSLSPEDRQRLVTMLRALGNPARFLIVEFLQTRSVCMTGDIVEHLPLAQSTVSVHLKVLKDAGWIQGTVDGAAVNYCLNREAVTWFRSQMATLG